MLSLLRTFGLVSRKASPSRNSFAPSLDMLEGRVTPAIIATYSASTIRISLTSTSDTAVIEKTDATGPSVTYSITNNNNPLSPVTVPIVGYSPNATVARIVVTDGSSGGSATGQKVSLTSNTNETYDLSAGLSITGIESVKIESAVGSVGTNGISITGASTGITLGANLTTTGGNSIRLDGPVILADNVILDADGTSTSDGDIEFTSTINSDSSGAYDLTIDAGSAIVSLAGNLGSTESLNTISVTGGAISLNGNVSGDGNITFTGPTTLKRNVLVSSTGSGSTIEFTGTVTSDSASTPRSLTVGTGGSPTETGDATFGGALGTSSLKLGSVIINRTGTTTLSGDINTSNAPVLFRGPVELNANVAISTGTTKGSVTFLDDLNSAPTTARSLTINAGSAAVSLKAVGTGTTDELGNTSITAGTINLEGDIETDNGAISLAGAVIIKGGNRTLSSAGGAITLGTASPLAGTVNGDTAGTRQLTIDSGGGNITINAAVGGIRRLDAFTISGSTTEAAQVVVKNLITANTIDITAKTLVDIQSTATLTGTTTLTATAASATVDVSGRFIGSTSVAGFNGTGAKTILRATSNSNFSITSTVLAPNDGTFVKTQPGRAATINFEDIGTVDLTGGTSGNLFAFKEWYNDSAVNGGGTSGTDTISFDRSDSTTDVAFGFTSSGNNLTIDGATQTITLSGIEAATLIGGPGDDTFTLSNWTGKAKLIGNAGADKLIWSKASTTSTLTATGFTAGTLQTTFNGIEEAELTSSGGTFNVNGFQGTVSLAGTSSATINATYNADFILNGTASAGGTITAGGNSITFSGTSTLQLNGGNRNNAFTLTGSAYTGAVTINGDRGNDVFNLGGSYTGVVVVNGDDGNDIFNLTGSYTTGITVNGGQGNDSYNLTGSYAGTITLQGGEGNDTYNITLPATGGSQVVTVTDTGTSSRDTINATKTGGTALQRSPSTGASGKISYVASPTTSTFPRIDFSGIEIVNLL